MGRGSSGFTLVEVIAAAALLMVLTTVGISTLHGTLRSVSRALDDARWNETVLLFERTVRSAVDDLPVPFWAPPPLLRREHGEMLIVANGGNGQAMLRLAQRGELLMVTTLTGTEIFRDIASYSVELARASDGREGGIRVELVGRRSRQEFVIAWRGQRL